MCGKSPMGGEIMRASLSQSIIDEMDRRAEERLAVARGVLKYDLATGKAFQFGKPVI